MTISNKAGIYKFTNLVNKKIYIGKAANLKRRISEHHSASTGLLLHRAIKKYGWHNFILEILHEYEIKPNNIELLALETAFIDYFESLTTKNGYNVCLFANDRTGIPMSPIAKEKIRNWHLNRGKRDEGIFKKISLAKMGHEPSYVDKKIYLFFNRKSQETFTGTRTAFIKEYHLNESDKPSLCRLIKGTRKRFRDWFLLN